MLISGSCRWPNSAMPRQAWLVGAVSVGIIVIAISQIYQVYTAKFREQLKRGEMSARAEAWATVSVRSGLRHGGRFGVMGIFPVQAALHANPNEARGLSGALQALEQRPFGLWVLGIVALGLVLYGIYMLLLARYRRIILLEAWITDRRRISLRYYFLPMPEEGLMDISVSEEVQAQLDQVKEWMESKIGREVTYNDVLLQILKNFQEVLYPEDLGSA